MRRAVSPQAIRLAAALACAVALAFVPTLIVGSRGLRGAYFTNQTAAGSPAWSSLDTEISTRQLQRRWRGSPPEQFSVRWFGFVAVETSGSYTFSLTSDDGGAVVIDGQRLIDSPGPHSPVTATARVDLEAGLHAIAIEYEQFAADYTLDLRWARAGESLRPIPGWALTPRRDPIGRLRLARAFDLAALVAWGVAAICAVWWIRALWPTLMRRMTVEIGRADTRSTAAPARASWAALLTALAFFVVITLIHLWPISGDPAHLSRNDNGDTMLNEWIVAWVAHQLPHDPAHLFSANIFYPEPDSLAFSESLIVQGVMGAPLLYLGASPVLTYNLLMMAGFALSAWAMCVVMHRWTGDWIAALVSGSLYGFNAHTLTRLPHMQALHVEFLPFALLALDELLRQPRLRHALSLTVWFTLQALTSIHLMVFSAFAIGISAIVSVERWWGDRVWRVMRTLAIAAVISGVILLPFLLPYVRASRAQEFSRSLGVVSAYSATWQDYLSTPARLHYSLWSYRFFTGTALFPGVLASLLAAVAIARGVAFRDPRARMCLAIAVTGIVLSFGVKVPGYGLLYQLIVPLQAIRAIVRIGYLGIVGIAALAGFGAVLVRRAVPARAQALVGMALVTVASFESLAAPVPARVFDGIPAIYRDIPTSPRAVVVEIPFYDVRAASLHAWYMLNSTVHWQPMPNGYSGFQTRSFGEHAEALRGFPDARAIALLEQLEAKYVVVHRDAMEPARADLIPREPHLQLMKTEGTISLYRFVR